MASQAYAKAGAGAKEHGFGWLTFAAVMLGFAGVYATIEGILAISRSKIFVGARSTSSATCGRGE